MLDNCIKRLLSSLVPSWMRYTHNLRPPFSAIHLQSQVDRQVRLLFPKECHQKWSKCHVFIVQYILWKRTLNTQSRMSDRFLFLHGINGALQCRCIETITLGRWNEPARRTAWKRRRTCTRIGCCCCWDTGIGCGCCCWNNRVCRHCCCGCVGRCSCCRSHNPVVVYHIQHENKEQNESEIPNNTPDSLLILTCAHARRVTTRSTHDTLCATHQQTFVILSRTSFNSGRNKKANDDRLHKYIIVT